MANEWSVNENKEAVNEKENIKQALEKIKETGIFDLKYLEKVSLVVFSMDGEAIELFENNRIKSVDSTDYNNEDFLQGKRVDFILIHKKEDINKIDFKLLNDKQILPFIFFEGKLSYEEFLTHEMAHNVFDMEYKKRYGEFKEKNGVVDVSEEYCEMIFVRLKKLIVESYPDLDISKFNLQRQKIAEIFAMIYQREFCKINKSNINSHTGVRKK